jgi:CelD/BcsL family acetyltransferase involved in cellulose biosynthesis
MSDSRTVLLKGNMAVPGEVAMAATWRIEVFSHPAAVSPDWPRGAEGPAQCHAFQTLAFLETWQASYGQSPDIDLCLVEVRDGVGRPVLMMPLIIRRSMGCRVLGFVDLGAADYNAPILFPTQEDWTEARARTLWGETTARLPAFDLAILDKMPEKVGALVNPLHLLADGINPESCHLTRLDRPWPEVEKAIQGAKNLRNRFRALQRLGSCELVVAETSEERAKILETLLIQKQRRFKETHVPGFDEHPEKLAFFTLGTEIMAKAGALHLSALILDDQILATYWGLVHGPHYYGLFISNESGEWLKYSPGRVLHYQLLQHLSAAGFVCLDLGIGNEAWKQSVCDVTVPLSLMIEARTLRGKLSLSWRDLRARLVATALWQKIRPLKWVLLRGWRDRKVDKAE